MLIFLNEGSVEGRKKIEVISYLVIEKDKYEF